jgi:glycosyltransferase involved in cell wall biosynthesis
MRIMVLGLRGFPGVQGGVETHAEHLYPLLVHQGCKIEVIARSPYLPPGEDVWQGVKLYRLWAPRINGLEALVHSILGVFFAGIKRPDVLHIHAVGPAIVTPLAKLLRLRVVVTHHGPDYDREKWGAAARWVLRLGESWGMRYADQRIVISETIRKLVNEKYGLDSVVIPNGVTMPDIPTSKLAIEKFGLTEGRYVLLVGRLVPEKRHRDLLAAFRLADLDGWKLVFVGGADYASEYSERFEREAGNLPGVVFTGFQSGEVLRELYANAGIFVLPSSHEGLPISLLEAMSYGIPVLASDIPANLEIGLSHDHYFPTGNIDALTGKLKALAPRAAAGINRKDYVEILRNKYNWKEIAVKTLRIYERALRQ